MTAKDVLRAYATAVILAEPLQIKLWREAGLTLKQLRVLRMLRDQPRAARELAELAGLSAPSATRVFARLEERGLLTRSVDEGDRRRIVIRLTSQGEDVLARNSVWSSSVFAEVAREMDPGARDAFVGALESFTARVRQRLSEQGGVGAGEQPLDA